MPLDEEFCRRAKADAEEFLFRIPGVYGVALGPKIIGGKLTSEPAIQVFVRRKRPVAVLPAAEIIPPEIDRLRTDVVDGSSPVEPTAGAAERCRTGKITSVSDASVKPVEITSPAHGLADENHVAIFGVPLDEAALFPVKVKSPDVFVLPATIARTERLDVEAEAFWIQPCTWEDDLCCCATGHITDAVSTNPVVITSPSHGLRERDRIKVVRITGMTQIRGKEFLVGKTPDKDHFELSGTDGTTFTMAGREDGDWARLCVDRTGPIQRVQRGTPIHITSRGHGLKRGDRVHVVHTGPITEIRSTNRPVPFTVDTVTPDTFTLKDVGTAAGPDDTSSGAWIRIFPDTKKYSRIRGGIRIAMQRDETVSVEVTASQRQPGSGMLVQKVPLRQSVTTKETLAYGTLGCLAIDNATGAKVLLSNYHVLHAVDEDNVHHPDYKSCKSNRIAERLRHANPGTQGTPNTVDGAIAKLTSGVKADPEIVDIGPVRGTAPILLKDILFDETNLTSDARGYRVRKRGVTSLLTEGIVTALDGTFGPAQDPDQDTERVFLQNQIVIRPMAGLGRGAFSLKGDSGAAVVNDKNEVVGLLVGNDGNGRGYASPIGEVERQLNIKIWAAPPGTPVAGTGGDGAGEDAEALVITHSVPDVVSQVADELLQTAFGATFISLVERHHVEVEQLIHGNRRVTVAWHRNDGPALLRELETFVWARTVPLPPVINGRLVRECAENIFAALRRFGSPQLVSDIHRYGPDLISLIGRSYSDVLSTLAAASPA